LRLGEKNGFLFVLFVLFVCFVVESLTPGSTGAAHGAPYDPFVFLGVHCGLARETFFLVFVTFVVQISKS